MKEIRCPKCGTVIQVDEAEYASIVSQVRTQEFEEEIGRREKEMVNRYQLLSEKQRLEMEQKFQQQLNQQQQRFQQKEQEVQRLQWEISNASKTEEMKIQQQLASKDIEIERLHRQHEHQIQEQQKIIEGLNARIENNESVVKNSVLEERIKNQELLQQKDSTIQTLQKEVDVYKNFKARLSTKMVGESLEQHCLIQFESTIRPLLPHAEFGKDNDVADGTKGDFIFRDFVGDVVEEGSEEDKRREYISIMFEMKNELDETATKHKNEDFLKKLHEDRVKKKCEYAVLVSMLEADNELYNNGIVDKSHLYEKMYVIRPQFFIPLITFLVNASKKTIDLQRQLVVARSQSLDVTRFEEKLTDITKSIVYNYGVADKHFTKAVEEIDKSIDHLTKIKEALMASVKNFRIASDKTEQLTIRKLTYNNPTMKALFQQVKENEANGEAE